MRTLIAIALCASLVACSADQITVTLEAAVDAAIAADAVARPQDQPYLALATGCLDQAEAILAGTSSVAIKSTAIGAACATAVAAGNSAGTGVQAVAIALTTFLRQVSTVAAQIRISGPANSFMASVPEAKLSKSKLKAIRKKINALKAKHAK